MQKDKDIRNFFRATSNNTEKVSLVNASLNTLKNSISNSSQIVMKNEEVIQEVEKKGRKRKGAEVDMKEENTITDKKKKLSAKKEEIVKKVIENPIPVIQELPKNNQKNKKIIEDDE